MTANVEGRDDRRLPYLNYALAILTALVLLPSERAFT